MKCPLGAGGTSGRVVASVVDVVKESGVLDLDIPPEVMKVVLFYIYTGSIPLSASAEIHAMHDEFLAAAELLAMPRFKNYLKKFVNESKSMTS